jgi:hypothetical protein
MGTYDNRDKPAYMASNSPLEYAKNPHILKWWTESHDEMLRDQIKKWAWVWYWDMHTIIPEMTPESILEEWRKEDPLCSQYAWYNILLHFAQSRAKQIGLTKSIRKAKQKKCPLCKQKFIENSLPEPLIKRLGIDHLDFCSPCLKDCILQNSGNPKLSKEKTIEYLKNLAQVIGRVPNQNYGEGMNDFEGIDDKTRLALIIVLQTKPTTKRVKELFGSWLAALIQAEILEDGTRRTSRGTQTLAQDGHVCLSLGEKTIDDYMYTRGVIHEKEPHYPEGNYRADFLIGDVFVEYFGLAGNPEYDQKTKLKQDLCKKHGIQLISIFPADLANLKNLEKKLGPILNLS